MSAENEAVTHLPTGTRQPRTQRPLAPDKPPQQVRQRKARTKGETVNPATENETKTAKTIPRKEDGGQKRVKKRSGRERQEVAVSSSQ